MDLRHLRYFLMVANERNFTRAAERLHIAQPPLSRAIQALEAELGANLFDRDSRPLCLTPAGRLLFEQASQILNRVDDMRTMMARAVRAQRRRFAVGFVASTIYARLPTIIRRFRKMAGDIDLQLVEIGSLEQIAALKDGVIDVGFGRIRFEDPALRRTVLREEPLVAAVPAESPLAREAGPVTLAQLAAYPQIIYPRAPRPSYADQVVSIFHDHSLDPRIAHEARELQTAVGMVAAEEGVCLVPESARKARGEDVAYLSVVETTNSPIIMSYRMSDTSDEMATMAAVISHTYQEWGYSVPEGIEQLAGRLAAGYQEAGAPAGHAR